MKIKVRISVGRVVMVAMVEADGVNIKGELWGLRRSLAKSVGK